MKNNAYLGIDIGSISTKGVIIDEQNNILAYEYIMTDANPISLLALPVVPTPTILYLL